MDVWMCVCVWGGGGGGGKCENVRVWFYELCMILMLDVETAV